LLDPRITPLINQGSVSVGMENLKVEKNISCGTSVSNKPQSNENSCLTGRPIDFAVPIDPKHSQSVQLSCKTANEALAVDFVTLERNVCRHRAMFHKSFGHK